MPLTSENLQNHSWIVFDNFALQMQTHFCSYQEEASPETWELIPKTGRKGKHKSKNQLQTSWNHPGRHIIGSLGQGFAVGKKGKKNNKNVGES